MTIVRRIARPLLASMFVWEGIDAIRHPRERAERATPAVGKLHELTGLPNDPALFVRINGAVMATAGLALAVGKTPRAAAWTLAAIMVPTTYAGQPFWSASDADERAGYRQGFVRNLSLIGGLIVAGVDTQGRPGLRWRRRNHREHKAELKRVRAEIEETAA